MNTKGFEQMITDMKPFLPADKHNYLETSCAYLLAKCSEFLAHPDPLRDDYMNNSDALEKLYCHLRRNFEECLESARAQAMSQSNGVDI